MSEISEAALAYAAKGWKVFPVPPRHQEELQGGGTERWA